MEVYTNLVELVTQVNGVDVIAFEVREHDDLDVGGYQPWHEYMSQVQSCVQKTPL
jgi:hypothetical protein